MSEVHTRATQLSRLSEEGFSSGMCVGTQLWPFHNGDEFMSDIFTMEKYGYSRKLA